MNYVYILECCDNTLYTGGQMIWRKGSRFIPVEREQNIQGEGFQ